MQTVNYIFSIGSSAKNLDMNGLTLQKIKMGIERVEKKVDKLILAPLNNALDHYTKGLNEIKFQKYENALESFKRVMSEATDGLNKMKDKDMNLESFKQCLTASKLIISAQIFEYSFDSEQNVFIPFTELSSITQELIATQTQVYVGKCIVMKENVTSNFWLEKNQKRNKGRSQDILDDFLRIFYPYISQGKRCTQVKTVLASSSVTMGVMPQYLPKGAEDMTEVTIGVLENNIIKIDIWKSDNYFFIKCKENVIKLLPVDAECEMINVDLDLDIKCNFSHVISSPNLMDGSEETQGKSGLFGEYQFGGYHEDKPYYIQRDNDGNDPIYLFCEDDDWFCGSELGNIEKCKLNIPSTSAEENLTCTMKPGALIPCDVIAIELGGKVADKFSSYGGQFFPTKVWNRGRPVYRNKENKYLFVKQQQGGFEHKKEKVTTGMFSYWSVDDKRGDDSETYLRPRIPWSPNCPAQLAMCEDNRWWIKNFSAAGHTLCRH